jgi:hypothetical protein
LDIFARPNVGAFKPAVADSRASTSNSVRAVLWLG